jgi:hypothetical protein
MAAAYPAMPAQSRIETPRVCSKALRSALDDVHLRVGETYGASHWSVLLTNLTPIIPRPAHEKRRLAGRLFQGDVHPWRRILGGELYGSAAPAGRPALRRQSAPQISGVYHWAAAARVAYRRRPALRHLGEVHRHAPRLVVRQPICSPSGATQRYVRNRGEAEARGLRLKRR